MAAAEQKVEAAKPLDEAKAAEQEARKHLAEALATGKDIEKWQRTYADAASEVEKARLAEEYRRQEAERKEREAEQQRQAENRERVRLQAAEFRKAAKNLHTKLHAFLDAVDPVMQEMSKLRSVCNQAGLPLPPRSEPEALISECYKTLVLHPSMKGWPDPQAVRTTPEAQHSVSVHEWAKRIEGVAQKWTKHNDEHEQ